MPLWARLLGPGRAEKNDPNDDARSVAIAALRNRGLTRVGLDDHAQVLKLLAKRHRDLAQPRAETASRLHALLMELQPGGMAKRMNVTRANGILDTITIDTAIECLLPDTVSLNTGVHMNVKTFWRRPESMVAVRTLGQSTRKTLRNTSQVGIQVQSGG